MKRILIVEDEEHLQILIKEELMDDGYEVMTASNGAEAISIIQDRGRSMPDLIIMDLYMPEMDGFEVMEYILKARIDTPIIIHTGYACHKVHPLTIAADAYIIKSHDLTALKTAISRLLRMRGEICKRLDEPAFIIQSHDLTALKTAISRFLRIRGAV
jgi:DNA-binding response OmpR family regulator